MAAYSAVLPQVFEYSVSVSVKHAKVCVDFLMQNDSSFAITVDDLPERCKMWMSATSYKDLEKAGLL